MYAVKLGYPNLLLWFSCTKRKSGLSTCFFPVRNSIYQHSFNEPCSYKSGCKVTEG